MGSPGAKPQGKVKIEWSSNFAYAIGLIASDGCLYSDGRHFSLTSKDLEQMLNFQKALNINSKIGTKNSGAGNQAFHLQKSDVLFCRFLNSIGLTSKKSLTIGCLLIPDNYSIDFVRGYFDGDGCCYSYWDKRWKSSFMFYISFASGSRKFIEWFRELIFSHYNLKGHMDFTKKKGNRNDFYQLKYSKYEAIKLANLMYQNEDCLRLSRKYLKIQRSLAIVRGHKGRTFVK